MSKEAFVELVTADQPDAPAYFTYDAVLNSRERPTLDQALARELKPLTLEEVAAAVGDGAQLLDTRDPAEFAAAHLAGSINIGLGGQYATWAGTLLDAARPIVIVADPGAETQSALRSRANRIRSGCRFSGWRPCGRRGGRPQGSARPVIVSTDRLSPQTAAERMDASNPPLVIDIRTPRERAEKSIDGSMHRPLNALREGLPDVARDRAIIVHCAGGYRSSIAASLLQRDGFTNVSEIAGGIAAWEAAGLPLKRIRPVHVIPLALTDRAIPFEHVARRFEADQRTPRRAAERMGHHPMAVPKHEPRIVAYRGGHVPHLHPALRLPAQKLNLFGLQVRTAGDRRGAVVFLDALIDDKTAFDEVARHRRPGIRCRVLDVRPVDVLARKSQIGRNRLARVVGVADDEAADDDHSMTVQDIDRFDGRVAGTPSTLARAVLRAPP